MGGTPAPPSAAMNFPMELAHSLNCREALDRDAQRTGTRGWSSIRTLSQVRLNIDHIYF